MGSKVKTFQPNYRNRINQDFELHKWIDLSCRHNGERQIPNITDEVRADWNKKPSATVEEIV
jgi:hypothetical protein